MKDALRSFSEVGHNTFMHYAYILRSQVDEMKYYHGSTSNLDFRLKAHNNGQSKYTAKYKPWKIVWFGGFQNKQIAEDFEKYLKTASGKAFYRKRLL